MKAVLWQRASELGFDDCRVTMANAPESAERFQHWLAERQHGEMAYLERTAPKRVDPQQVLPGARSIITLAVSYHKCNRQSPIVDSQAAQAESSSGRQLPLSPHRNSAGLAGVGDWRSGLIARYARYRDYHDILGERLKQLADFVNQLGGEGTRSLWYVDTGPLLERDLAQRAGLGFIGKHTNLISRQLGN